MRALNYRAKELDLKLPLLESIMPSNEEHLERAVEMVLGTGKRKIGMLGLSFKAATDDLRESPHVQLVKRLLGEGREIRIWDDNVSLGRLIGSNREYIEQVIPHIGSLLNSKLGGSSEGRRRSRHWHARSRPELSAEAHSPGSRSHRSGQSGESATSPDYGSL